MRVNWLYTFKNQLILYEILSNLDFMGSKKMYTIIFQLSGSLLLSWMIISRSKKEIIRASWTVVNTNKKINPQIHRIFRETYLSLFGFSYISFGYILQLFSLNDSIQKWLYLNNPINRLLDLNIYISVIINLILLISFGIFIAYSISKYRYNKVSLNDIEKNAPEGAIKVDH